MTISEGGGNYSIDEALLLEVWGLELNGFRGAEAAGRTVEQVILTDLGEIE